MEPLRGEDPRQVGRYRLVARLGAGGMGQVFLGFSPTGRPVAVKMVHPELARDKAFLSRFRQETAAARKVSGAYTASVVDAGEGDRPWLATSLVLGPSLADTVEQQGPLPEVSVWRLAAGLAEALGEVHRSGLIHRDLKPSNVLLATDGPRVIDFGISRALDGTSLTGTGMVVGTPSFMSPEQASGITVGPASDVFSFGGVVTFAATGTGPFGDGSPVALIYRVVHGDPMVTGLPGALNGLVTRCLAKRPEDRPALDELIEIITANVEPATSATSFWPQALTEFITSYQARFTADAQAWSAPAPRQAEPVSPPRQAEPVPPPRQAEPVSPQESTVPPGPADLPGTAGENATEGHLEPPTTITVSRDGPSHPSVSAPPAYTPPPTSPPPAPPPPVSRPARRPRRRAMIAGIGAAAAAVLAVAVVLATSLSSGNTPGLSGGASTSTSTSASSPISSSSGSTVSISVGQLDRTFSAISALRPLAALGKGNVTAILPDTVSSTRYAEFDAPYLTQAMTMAGLSSSQYSVVNAQGSDATELSDAQEAITKGASVLIMDPLDSGVGAQIESYAKAHGVAVIDYDRLTSGGSRAYYVSFNYVEVGKLIGQGFTSCATAWHVAKPNVLVMRGDPTDNNATLFAQGYLSVLNPLFANGSYVNVGEPAGTWDPLTAESEFQQAFTAHQNINSVLTPNDANAAPIIHYLQTQGVKPNTFPVTGQDATLVGLQNILAGYQCGTVYKPIYLEAQAAVALAMYLRAGKTPPGGLVNGRALDSQANVPVPSVLLTPTWVTTANMNSTVIADQFVPAQQLCVGSYAAACTSAGISA